MPAIPRQKTNYDDITPVIISDYKTLHNILTVAKRHHLSVKAVRTILNKSGINTSRHVKASAKVGYPPGSCGLCGSYSPCRIAHGYCLTHRRSVSASQIEACFH